jgi:hypothetical protein
MQKSVARIQNSDYSFKGFDVKEDALARGLGKSRSNRDFVDRPKSVGGEREAMQGHGLGLPTFRYSIDLHQAG